MLGFNFYIALVAFFFANMAHAQVSQDNTVIKVNGRAISSTVFEQNLKANLNQGLKDTPQLRQTIKDELINRELLVQHAEKLGIDKTPEAQMQLKQLREIILVEMLLSANLKLHPITEDDIRADYQRQLSLLNQSGEAQQYKLSVIVVPSELQAWEIYKQLKRGSSFDQLAKDRSLDPSKVNGGLVGWVLPNQINTTVAELMVKTKVGSIAGPVSSGDGWSIIKVNDKRPFKTPSLDESKDGIVQLLLKQRSMQLVNQLRAESKITP